MQAIHEMTAYFQQLDDLLRGRIDVMEVRGNSRAAAWLAAQVFVFGIVYGAAMGTFGGIVGERAWQMAFSACKVPLLLLVTFALGLPSFFVLNTLYGLRADFGEALRALLAAQATMTLILASLAPMTLTWYASSADYTLATLFNGMMFALATFAAQWLLRRFYRPLLARSPRHRWLLRAWLLIYTFVGIQMAWVLRPFIGNPEQQVQFFREDSWSNAYVVVVRLVWSLIAY